MGFHLVWQIMSCAGFALIALFLAWSPGAYADANVTAFLLNLVKDGKLQINEADEIHRETLLTRAGEIVNARVREFFGLPALAAKGA